MENNAISVLNTLFYVCLSLCIVFFIITVVLFFLFDIRAIFSIRTGRAKRKTVDEMMAANANTGRLRVGGKTLTSKLDKSSGLSSGLSQKLRIKKAVITPAAEAPQIPVNSSLDSGTALLPQEFDQPRQSPAPVSSPVPAPAPVSAPAPSDGQTELLPPLPQEDLGGTGMTQRLSPGSAADRSRAKAEAAQSVKESIHFTVTKRVMEIGTDEQIA